MDLYNDRNKNELKSLTRFLSREREAGYIFTYIEGGKVFDHDRQERLKADIPGLEVLFLNADSDQTIIGQIENHLQTHKANSLIIANLDELLSNKENSKKILTELNFAREGFYRFQIPIVFWISESTFSVLSNGAPDLYSQRRLSTLIFEPEDTKYVNEQVLPLVVNEANYIYKNSTTSDRLLLLEEQYKEALVLEFPKKRLINSFVLPYLEELAKNFQKDKALELLALYEDEFNTENPQILKRVAQSFEVLHLPNKAILYHTKYLELDQSSEIKANGYISRGLMYYFVGKINQALEDYKFSQDIFTQLIQSEAENNIYLRGLSICYEKIGDMLRLKGNNQEALKQYNLYLKTATKLNKKEPKNWLYKNSLAISHERVGSIYESEGQLNLALDHFKKYLTLKSELLEEFPQDIDFKNGVSISHERLGGTYILKGDTKKALIHFEKSLKLSSELVETVPGRIDLLNNLAISYSKLGNIYKIKNELNKAFDYFMQAVDIENQLVKIAPDNVHIKNSLAVSHFKLGEVYIEQNEPLNAKLHFEKCKKIMENLVETAPDYKKFEDDLDEVTQTLSKLNTV